MLGHQQRLAKARGEAKARRLAAKAAERGAKAAQGPVKKAKAETGGAHAEAVHIRGEKAEQCPGGANVLRPAVREHGVQPTGQKVV